MTDAPPPGPFSGDQPPSEQPPGSPLPGASNWQPQGYGYAAGAPAKTPGLATASLVCGIISIPFGSLILAVLAIVFGIVARNKIDKSNGALTGRSRATAGLICGIVGLAAFVVYLVVLSASPH